jgi:hypothetical protein
MVLADSHRISPVPCYSGIPLGHLSYSYRAITFYGAAFQAASNSTRGPVCRPYNPKAAVTTLVWAVPRSLATTWGITIVFSSSGYLDVSVLRVGFIQLCIHCTMTGLQPAGLPHSEIHGSKVVCTSPWLNAAYHVLLRLFVPRHPPYALTYLSPAIVHGLDSCRFDALMSRYFNNGSENRSDCRSNRLCFPTFLHQNNNDSEESLILFCFRISAAMIPRKHRYATALRNNHYVKEREAAAHN